MAGVVIVGGGEDFIAWLELQRAQDGIDSGRGVGHKDQVLGPGADKLRHLAAGHRQSLFVAPPKELDRFSLHLAAQVRLGV